MLPGVKSGHAVYQKKLPTVHTAVSILMLSPVKSIVISLQKLLNLLAGQTVVFV